jgi:hypothetical protein
MKAQPLWHLIAVPNGPHPEQAAVSQGQGGYVAPASPIEEAAVALWALFDVAYSRAGVRAAQAPAPGCTKEVLTPFERRYRQVDARSEQQSIAVSLMLSVVDGRVRGGALITTSRPYLSLFAAPVAKRGQIHWRVGTSGQSLTVDLVEDLFLSVLENNAEATRRLTPFVTNSLG